MASASVSLLRPTRAQEMPVLTNCAGSLLWALIASYSATTGAWERWHKAEVNGRTMYDDCDSNTSRNGHPKPKHAARARVRTHWCVRVELEGRACGGVESTS